MKTRNNKRRKGFTLIELIVVIAILAILAAIAVPNFIGMTKKANDATEVAAAAEYANAINIYNTLNPTAKITSANMPASLTALDTTLTTDLAPKLSSGINTTNVYAKISVDATGIATVNKTGSASSVSSAS